MLSEFYSTSKQKAAGRLSSGLVSPVKTSKVIKTETAASSTASAIFAKDLLQSSATSYKLTPKGAKKSTLFTKRSSTAMSATVK